MKCTLKKPLACFNCPYEDCLDYSAPSKEETLILNEFIPDRKSHRTDARRKSDRSEYFKQYYEAHIKEKKVYCAQRYKQYKATELPNISAWKIWGCGFYINLDTREKVKECLI